MHRVPFRLLGAFHILGAAVSAATVSAAAVSATAVSAAAVSAWHELHILVRYPPAFMDTCKAALTYSTELSPLREHRLPLTRLSASEHTATVNYTGDDVSRRIVVSFELVLPFDSSAATLKACADVCPWALYSFNVRHLGAPFVVVLAENSTRLEAYPWFCTTTGKVERHQMPSPQLNNTRPVYVYRPPGLLENPIRRPVSLAVLHDGQILSLGPLFQTMLDSLVVTGDVRELVVAAVDSRLEWDSSKNYRGALLTPSRCEPSCRCPPASAWCRAGCGPEATGLGPACTPLPAPAAFAPAIPDGSAARGRPALCRGHGAARRQGASQCHVDARRHCLVGLLPGRPHRMVPRPRSAVRLWHGVGHLAQPLVQLWL